MTKKVSLFVLFFISIAVFFVWTKLNQKAPLLNQEQKKEALENILGRDVREEKVTPQGEKTYQGKYFSLSYPAYATLYERESSNITASKKLLEYFRLDSEEPKFRFVVMFQEAADLAALDELSAVKTRRQNRLYKESQFTIDDNTGILFVKTQDGVERSSLFIKDGHSFSFSITGIDAGELERVYEDIMESVRF